MKPSWRRRLTVAPLAAALTLLPLIADFSADSAPGIFRPPVAAAKDGGGDNSGSGGSGSGGGDSGHGGDDSGHGGDSGDDDDGGKASADDDDGRREGGKRRWTGPHGEKIERTRHGIRVEYPDGYREEIEDGRFEMKDPRGRTVIKRAATQDDAARLRALGR